MSDNLQEREEVLDSFQAYEALLQSRLERLRSVSGFVSEMKVQLLYQTFTSFVQMT
jgi:hypothetical protein